MIEGEDILDEAKDFSCQLLKTQVKHLDHYQARVTENTLEHPYHKSLPRFLDKCFLDDFNETRAYFCMIVYQLLIFPSILDDSNRFESA